MSRVPGASSAIDAASGRNFQGCRTAREVEALRRNGTPVVVFRPGKAEQEAMGNDFMARDRVHEIVQQSFFGVGAQSAARPEMRSTLATLLGSERLLRANS